MPPTAVARQSRRGWRIDRPSRAVGENIDAIVALGDGIGPARTSARRTRTGRVDVESRVSCAGRLTPDSYCASHAQRNGSTRSWRKLRGPQVLERDGYRFQQCGAPATEVDHIMSQMAAAMSRRVSGRAACLELGVSVPWLRGAGMRYSITGRSLMLMVILSLTVSPGWLSSMPRTNTRVRTAVTKPRAAQAERAAGRSPRASVYLAVRARWLHARREPP